MKRVILLAAAIVLLIGCSLLGGYFAMIVGFQPCGWLDSSFNHSGCIRQLDIEPHYNVTFTRDLTMFGAGVSTQMNVWGDDGELLHAAPGQVGVFSPDDTVWVQGSLNKLLIWNIKNWTLQNTLDTNTSIVTEIAIAPDMGNLTVVGRDNTTNGSLQVWQSDGKLLHDLEGYTDHVLSIAYSPTGETLASGGEDDKIRLWRVKDGELLKTLKGHSSFVEKVVFAPNGMYLASASWDSTIRVWRVDEGRLLHILEGHDGNVLDIAYSPNGFLLASAGSDGVVKLWDVNAGTQISNLRHNWQSIPVEAVAFSLDGKVLATAQRYGPVRFFDVQQMLQD